MRPRRALRLTTARSSMAQSREPLTGPFADPDHDLLLAAAATIIMAAHTETIVAGLLRVENIASVHTLPHHVDAPFPLVAAPVLVEKDLL